MTPSPAANSAANPAIDAAWNRIERWLAAHAPALLADLNPPATAADLAAFAQATGLALPAEAAAAYARHNGQRGAGPPLFGEYRLLPLHLAARAALDMRAVPSAPASAHGPVQPAWWHPGWLPVLSNGAGRYLCLDLAPPPAPPPGGTPGQVVQYDSRSPHRSIAAPGFAAWLTAFAQGLQPP